MLNSEKKEKNKRLCVKKHKKFMLEQIHEIEIYKWLRSEQENKDIGDIAVIEWIEEHAANFRKEWEYHINNNGNNCSGCAWRFSGCY